MIIVWLLYGLTALVAALLGYICLRNQSAYPNTSTGYRFGGARCSAEAWASANVWCGKLSIGVGLCTFGVVPGVIFLLGASMGWMLGAYFVLVVLWACIVFFVPQVMINRKM